MSSLLVADVEPGCISFVCMNEPNFKDPQSLYSVFQPTLVMFTPRAGAHSAEAEKAKEKMVEPLMHKTVGSLKSNPKARGEFEKELADHIVSLMVARNWRGHLEGVGHSKLDPLLTRLAGGMKMWRGEREYKEAIESAPADEVSHNAQPAEAVAGVATEAGSD